MELNILDQAPVSKGANGQRALEQTTELARLADRLGYNTAGRPARTGGTACSPARCLASRFLRLQRPFGSRP